jgi:glycosyltransferase involved in cell wall biosynthesis
LVLVGEGPERPNIEKLVEELELGASVRLLGFRSNARDLLPGADGFILTSRSEALPVSLLEAGAAGLVLISSKVGGVAEIIEDERSGLLFRSGDSEMLAEKICLVLEHAELRKEYSEQIKLFVDRHFSLDRVVDEHVDLYRRLAL